jgi:hypothetical protein
MMRKSLIVVPALALLILAGLGLKGLVTGNTLSTTVQAAAEPVVQGCTGVAVTDIRNENVGLTLGEKVTVDWTFTPPTGVGNSCIGVEGFKVHIVVTRRNGKTDDRNLDLNASARSASVTFSEAGNKIKTVNATVTAKFSGAAVNSKTENSDN